MSMVQSNLSEKSKMSIQFHFGIKRVLNIIIIVAYGEIANGEHQTASQLILTVAVYYMMVFS